MYLSRKFENIISDKDISLKLHEKLRTMRRLKDPPKINLNLNRLNGMRLGSQSRFSLIAHISLIIMYRLKFYVMINIFVDIAELVHYVSFHNVNKPLWVSLRPNRGILQAVIFRIQCDLETVVSYFRELKYHAYCLGCWKPMISCLYDQIESIISLCNV